MNRYLACLTNDRGSALLVAILLIPVLTLFCVFASTISFQNEIVTINDKCYHDGLYDADGALYATAKLISLIEKTDLRSPVEAGEGNAAPGMIYLSTGGDAAQFRDDLTSPGINASTDEIQFVRTDSTLDFGIEATVDITKIKTDTDQGGGAEFANQTSGGPGAQLNWVQYRMQSTGRSGCSNTNVPLVGIYYMIATKGAQIPGI